MISVGLLVKLDNVFEIKTTLSTFVIGILDITSIKASFNLIFFSVIFCALFNVNNDIVWLHSFYCNIIMHIYLLAVDPRRGDAPHGT